MHKCIPYGAIVGRGLAPADEYSYTYDDFGNLISETLHKTTESSDNTWVTTYTYSNIWTFAELLESK